MTLAEFLLARIAEDEDQWREAAEADVFLRNYAPKALAESEAKRRVVAVVEVTEDKSMPTEAWIVAKDVLRALALPYADHPDYREEWRA